MEDYFQSHCDIMPNSAGQRETWNLPANTRKKEVYEVYCDWLQGNPDNGEPLGSSYFYEIWTAEFEEVNIPMRARFSECTEYVVARTLCRAGTPVDMHGRSSGTLPTHGCFRCHFGCACLHL